MGTLLVGRPKKSAKPDALSPKTIGFRVSGEYGEWLDRLAKRHRTTVAGIMDRALAEWAKAQGHDEEPPERMP